MDTPTPQSPDPQPMPSANSEALLLAILESLPFRVYAYDLSGRCILQNQISIRDFGAVVGRSVAELGLPPALIERWLVERRRALSGEVVWDEQDIPLQGNVRTYRYSIAPIRVAGAICGTVGVDIDITDQRRTEQALRESEARYRLLADHSTDLITRHATTGEYLYASPAVRTLLGREPVELIGKLPFDNIHPEDRPRIIEQMEEMRRTGRSQTATMRVRRADGQCIWMEAAGQAVLDPATGQLTEFIVTSRDVTRRVEANQKLRQREAELAHLDRLSTMGQMASELAHELSQPLYAITNFADACLGLVDRPGELATDELRRWLEKIGQQARRGGDVLRRITQFVRKGELHRQPLDLNDSVRDVLAMLEFELRRHAVEVQVELAGGPLMVAADALLIEQVLINLVRNAEEAMEAIDPAQRRLSVRTFTDSNAVGAAVSDTGPGLPEGANQLFESYFTTKPHGTGLGLAICRSTIEAHHGRIWATRNAAGGATFQFVLPVTGATQNSAAKPASSA